MPAARRTIFFDVNETLSDLEPLAGAFEGLGLARESAATWFAGVLRDGFALTVTGDEARFADLAAHAARSLLARSKQPSELKAGVDEILAAMASVGLHPDVGPGIRGLHSDGHRLLTLSNGPTATAERLLREAGLLNLFDGLLSVEGHSPWKPAREAYLSAIARAGADPQGVVLVAVHPWDTHGAAAAGLSTVWVDRAGVAYPPHFTSPTLTVSTLTELASELRAVRRIGAGTE